jgi:hypothetical protein
MLLLAVAQMEMQQGQDLTLPQDTDWSMLTVQLCWQNYVAGLL